MKKYPKFLFVCASLGLLAGATATAQEAEQAPAVEQQAADTLEVGSEVPSLTDIEYIQGDPINADLNTEGETYLIELWATWCGPCIDAMPHLKDLYEEYEEDGLRVVAMNVFENDKPKVVDFLETNDDMVFPVALSGARDSTFAQEWLEPLGVRGIPTSVIVQDGKIVMVAHPSEITEEVMDKLVSGEFDAEAHAEAKAESDRLMAELQTKASAQDWEGVLELVDELEEVNPERANSVRTLAMLNLERYADLMDSAADMELEDRVAVYGQVFSGAEASEDLVAAAKDANVHEQISEYLGDDVEAEDFILHLVNLRVALMTDADEEAVTASHENLKSLMSSEEFTSMMPAESISKLEQELSSAVEAGEMEPLRTVMSRLR